MINPIKSVAATIKRLLQVDDKVINALMPHGDSSPQHYIGGYDMLDGKSEVEAMYERDTDGWIVLD